MGIRNAALDRMRRIRQKFKNDTFATKVVNVEAVYVDDCNARCKLNITPEHLNAHGNVMGGVIFTLADYTFGVASNSGYHDAVTVDAHIVYLNPARGKTLISDAHLIREGKTICVYRIDITDESGQNIAVATMTGMMLNAEVFKQK